MNGYAVDTNIISFMMRGDRRLQERVYNEANTGKGIVIPAIVYYELKRGLLGYPSPTKLGYLERLCDFLNVANIDMKTLDEASSIYATLKKTGRIIDDADILIGAFCIAHDYTLVTDNTRHFERIAESNGLKIENWLEQTP